MSDTINGKTPDEIKKGLECCLKEYVNNGCNTCPYETDRTNFEVHCTKLVIDDMFALIQQQEQQLAEKDARIAELERERDQYKVERDTAVKALGRYRKCIDCINYKEVAEMNFACEGCEFGSEWQWSGRVVAEGGKR